MAKNKKSIYVTKSAAQTKTLGFLLAKTVLEIGAGKRARVLALRGDLGAGKTHFAQGFARGLGVTGTVNSPTFVILRKYPLDSRAGFKMFYHIDCYRLGSGNDLEQLGIKKILADPADIVIVEWPDVAAVPSENFLNIDFEVAGKNDRRITIN